MVYLIEITKKIKADLLKDNIQSYCYYYLCEKENLNNCNLMLYGLEDSVALCGYTNLNVDKINYDKVLKSQPKKGLHFSTNIFQLIGIYLINPKKCEEYIHNKYNNSDIKHKYLICKFAPNYLDDFKQKIKNKISNNNYESIFNFLINNEECELSENILNISQDNPDIIDLIIFQDLQKKLLDVNIINNRIINKSPKELVIQVLKQFSNSIKKITLKRRKGHNLFSVNDEYDVQDLLYIIIKSVFPNFSYEEPITKTAGSSSKVEFCLKDEGIMIEIKMIKESDNDEKKFIKELKEDNESYYKYEGLKDLIFFIYDPNNKTRDANNFNDLKGRRVKSDYEFNTEVIYSN